jgi:hypothetical protein
VRAYPLVPWILCGERSENLDTRNVFVAKTREENPFTSIRLRLTLHPLHTRVKWIQKETFFSLNPGFREATRSVLLSAGGWEKWGLSVGSEVVCLSPPLGRLVTPESAPGAAKRGWRMPQGGVAAGWRPVVLGVQPGCNPDATRMQRGQSVATGWRPVGAEGTPKCGGRGEIGDETRRNSRARTEPGGSSCGTALVIVTSGTANAQGERRRAAPSRPTTSMPYCSPARLAVSIMCESSVSKAKRTSTGRRSFSSA